MPQLGMAQDSAVLLAWRKAVGDSVSAGDVLLEVETDKAVMEVEARYDGYLLRVDVEAGGEAAVGSVIAVIADSADAAVGAVEQSVPAASPAATTAAGDTSTAAAAAAATGATGRAAGDRILASPKARRLAAERGVSLRQLLDAGMGEPILARDLPDAAQLASIRAGTGASTAAAPGVLRAHYDAAAFAEFARWAVEYSEGALDAAAIWASFALAARERAHGEAPDRREAPWRVRVQTLRGADRLLALRGCTLGAAAESALEPSEGQPAGATPDLQLHELSDSAIDDLQCRPGGAPTLVITRRGDEGRLALHYDQSRLATASALRWLDGIARRAAEPLQHLL